MGKYVDRGDPIGYDFILANLITDNAWHDLDLSGIVAPAGAEHLVHLVIIIKATKSDNKLLFREKGNVNEINRVLVRTQTANIAKDKDCFTMLDVNRKLEYKADIDQWTAIAMAVRGWIED